MISWSTHRGAARAWLLFWDGVLFMSDTEQGAAAWLEIRAMFSAMLD
jgi:hypothetical protein